MKTLLAILIGAAALAIASMTPASAQESVPLKCLVLGGINQSVPYDVCRCVIVKVDPERKKLLRPNPIKISAMCPFISNGGGGGQVSDVSDDTPRGHGFSFSKASSSSSFIGIAVGGSVPIAVTILGEHTTSIAAGDGGSAAGAGSSGNAVATGPGTTVTIARVTTPTSSSATSATGGSTGGSSCAGSCGGGGGGSQ